METRTDGTATHEYSNCDRREDTGSGAGDQRIVLAFVNDPVARWAWPEPHAYLIYFTDFTNVFGGKAFEHGTAHSVAEFSGGALWLPPGVQPDEKALVALMERSIDPEGLQVVLTMLERMQGYHPTEPHRYLPLIGVEPAKQGRGLFAYGLLAPRYCP